MQIGGKKNMTWKDVLKLTGKQKDIDLDYDGDIDGDDFKLLNAKRESEKKEVEE